MRFLLLFTVIFFICGVEAKLPGWEKKREFNRKSETIQMYSFKSNSNITVAIKDMEKKKAIKWRFNIVKVMKKLIKPKQESLSLIGISGWKVNEKGIDVKKGKGFKELKLEGVYRDLAKKKIKYTEKHYYFPKRTVQVLYTRPIKTRVKNDQRYYKQIMKHIEQEVL